MPEASLKRRLIAEATIANNQHVLDLGCGTATLTLLIKELHLDATVTGIDGDEKILQIGRTKVKKAGTATPSRERWRLVSPILIGHSIACYRVSCFIT